MSSPIAVGSIVADTYRITSQLGLGGMGSVWAAEHLRLPGKRVAIKVLHAALSSQEVLLRFRREAEITSRIGHPNIVEVLDFNALPGGEPFLVMELLVGESLAARLRRGRLPEKSALDIARQIGSALFAAHRLQVVHRDLKPDNIFLCPRDVDGELRDHVKVLDFGISKIRNSQTVVTQDASLMGTPYYMSPEQATGKNQQIDERTDIFALGAILFEMLSGQTAFPGDSLPSVIFQVVFQPHPAILQTIPALNRRVAAAIDRALAKDPAERFQDMSAFVEALTGRPLVTLAGGAAEASSAAAQAQSSSASRAVPLEVTARRAGLESAPPVAPTLAVPSAVAALADGSAPAAAVPAPGAVPASGATSLSPPAPVPVQTSVRGKSSTRLWGVIGVLGAAAAAVAVATVGRHRGSETTSPETISTVSATATRIETAPSRTPFVEPAPDAGAVSEKRPENLAQATPPKSPDKPADSRKHGGPRDEVLPATVAAELDAAERALATKDPAEAIRRARHSLYEKKSSRASAILIRAYCMQGDLGAAKAELPHLASPDRPRVLRACRAAGLEL